jgi:hypothetical protein
MTTRLSQKQVGDRFLETCKGLGIPTDAKYNKKTERYNHGFFTVGGAYGRMRIEWVMKCGGSRDLSGYLNAREMYLWLQNFHYLVEWKKQKKEDTRICPGIETQRKFMRARGPVGARGS